ncbi:MAG: hypothetical protein NTW90_07750 [Nitrosospira sp.]|nr:hypothetical protein [Nitrosospira sp.]
MGLFAFLGVLLLVVGYSVILTTPEYKARIHHYDGAHLNLFATQLGAMAFGVSFFLAYICQGFLDYHLQRVLAFYKLDPHLFLFTVVNLLLPFAHALIRWLFNSFFAGVWTIGQKGFSFFRRFFPKEYLIRVRAMVAANDPLENIILNSLLTYQHLLITLKSGKVYVGQVVQITDRAVNFRSEPAILMVLSASGHRNKDSQICEINHLYKERNAAGVESKVLDGEVCIRLNEVFSISPFIGDTHNALTRTQIRRPVGFVSA